MGFHIQHWPAGRKTPRVRVERKQPPDLSPVALALPNGVSFMAAKRAGGWLLDF